MSSADSKDRESTREQSDDDSDDMAGEADRSDPVYSEWGGVMGAVQAPGIASYLVVTWVFVYFSSIRRSLRALKLSFSNKSLALASSSSFNFISISSILVRFLSLAF